MSDQPSYRLLMTADIPHAQRLRSIAKWNQVDRDWQNLLAFEPQGCFAAEMDGKVVGTATTTRFIPASGPGSFGWVGMVLVDPDYRRHGIGSTLLKKCIAYLKDSGVETVKLDATPMGKLVYEKIGFASEYDLERWEGVAKPVHSTSTVNVQVLAEQDLAQVIAYDSPIFGADRSAVLRAWFTGWPEQALVVGDGAKITGYALARRGMTFQQIGPVVGDSPEICEALLIQSLTQLAGKQVIVDVVTANAWAAPLAAKFGLKHQRPFLRMANGANSSPGNRRDIFAICCPELG
jgi:GNAT superfamily N-acetyltransferase